MLACVIPTNIHCTCRGEDLLLSPFTGEETKFLRRKVLDLGQQPACSRAGRSNPQLLVFASGLCPLLCDRSSE